MKVYLERTGLYVHIIRPTEGRRAIGFKVIWGRPLMFSERYGYARGFKLGRLWIGTFAPSRRGAEFERAARKDRA